MEHELAGLSQMHGPCRGGAYDCTAFSVQRSDTFQSRAIAVIQACRPQRILTGIGVRAHGATYADV